MAKFEIKRARQELRFTPSTAVRADIDVRTGEGQVGAAIGQAGLELGIKYDLKQANTQFSEYKRKVGESNIQRNIEIANELDPDKHAEIFQRFTEVQKQFLPTNRRAQAAAGIWDNQQAPINSQALVDSRKLRTRDNERTEVFLAQQQVGISGDMGTFERDLARIMFIDKENPDDVGPSFTRLEAAKILADTRKMADVGNVTNLYGAGDFNGAKKAARESKLLTPKERESLLNTIGAEEASLREQVKRDKQATINTATSNALREYFTVDPLTGKSALDITTLNAQHERGLIKDSEFKFMIQGLQTEIPKNSDPRAMGAIRRARIDFNIGAINRIEADNITAENFVKLNATDRASVFADLEDISAKIIATAESNAISEGRQLISRQFLDISGTELEKLIRALDATESQKEEINRQFTAETANRDLYERAVQDKFRQMRKDGITDTTKFSAESLRILLEYKKRKNLTLRELEAEVGAEQQQIIATPIFFGPAAPKLVGEMTNAEKLAELRILTR